MHEYALVQALFGQIDGEAARRGATAVHRVRVRVGELAGVEHDLFRTAFETFRQGTLCAGADLDLEVVPASWTCPRCRRPLERGGILRCPDCGGPARLSDGADALFLETLEMEVP